MEIWREMERDGERRRDGEWSVIETDGERDKDRRRYMEIWFER